MKAVERRTTGEWQPCTTVQERIGAHELMEALGVTSIWIEHGDYGRTCYRLSIEPVLQYQNILGGWANVSSVSSETTKAARQKAREILADSAVKEVNVEHTRYRLAPSS